MRAAYFKAAGNDYYFLYKWKLFSGPCFCHNSIITNLQSRDNEMLKRTLVIFVAAAFFSGAAPTQTAQARDYYDDDDDIWDLMDPSWWADEFFDDDDDDDWWYYRRHPYNPYWGGPYVQHPRVIVIQQPKSAPQNPETRLPE